MRHSVTIKHCPELCNFVTPGTRPAQTIKVRHRSPCLEQDLQLPELDVTGGRARRPHEAAYPERSTNGI